MNNKLLKVAVWALLLCHPAKPFDWDSDPILDQFSEDFQTVAHQSAATTRADPSSVFNLLFNEEINAHNVIKDPFYDFTNPIRRRSPLDTDFMQFPSYERGVGLTSFPFFTQTGRAYFRDDKKEIQSYVDMQQKRLTQVLDDIEFTDFDLPKVLSLFKNLKVQERRLGLMFQYNTFFRDWDISLLIPFMYQEHNFYLTRSEIKRIENEPLFQSYEVDVIEFARQHLISDKIGFGDLRISLEKLVKESYRYQLSLGLDITIPTAWSIAKGLIGAHFDSHKKAPDFKLYRDLIEPGVDGNAEIARANFAQIGVEGLDRLATILLEHKLGNNRHPALGFFVRNRLNFTPECYLTTKAKLELELPGKERRFFKVRINPAELDAIAALNIGDDDDAAATVELNKIDAIFLEKFFPESYRTSIFPGCAAQITTQLSYERKNWTLQLGTDWWYHSKEVIGKIDALPATLDKLDVPAGRLGHALQNKIWVGLDRAHQENSYFDWSIRASVTGLSYGIGKDFTLGIQLSRDF